MNEVSRGGEGLRVFGEPGPRTVLTFEDPYRQTFVADLDNGRPSTLKLQTLRD